jgi:hypothetical protein
MIVGKNNLSARMADTQQYWQDCGTDDVEYWM